MKYRKLTQSMKDSYAVSSRLDLPLSPEGYVPSFLYGKEMYGTVPNPLEIELDHLRGGNPRHFIEGASILGISDLLLQAFKKAGVDNYQFFPVVLLDKRNKTRQWDNYYGFNVVGLIDAIAQKQCEYGVLSERDEAEGGFPLLAFDKVVLSAAKLKDVPKIFRLVQCPFDQLYISEDVITVLMEMCPPEKWGITLTEVEII
jgi:hypothetical protein